MKRSERISREIRCDRQGRMRRGGRDDRSAGDPYYINRRGRGGHHDYYDTCECCGRNWYDYPYIYPYYDDGRMQLLEKERTIKEPKLKVILTRVWVPGHAVDMPPHGYPDEPPRNNRVQFVNPHTRSHYSFRGMF